MFRDNRETRGWRAIGVSGWRAMSVLSMLGLTLASTVGAGHPGQSKVELLRQAEAPSVAPATPIAAVPMNDARGGLGATDLPTMSAEQVVGRQAGEWMGCATAAAFAAMWPPFGIVGGIICYLAVVRTWGK